MSYLDQYQEFVKTTAIYPDANTGNIIELMYLANGLCSEAGEVSGKIKKLYRDQTFHIPEERRKLISEIGDCMYYLAMLTNALETTLTKAIVDNRDKLTDRKDRGVLGGSGDNR